MGRIVIGGVETHEKLTARLYFQPSGENGYYDLGNVAEYRDVTERQFRTHAVAHQGFRRVDDEQVDLTHDKYEFVLTERDAFIESLRALGVAGADNTVSAVTAPSGTASITAIVLGRTYFIGTTALNTVVVKVGATTLTADADYILDADAGIITFPLTAPVAADDDDIDITFGNAARTFENFTSLNTPLRTGSIKLVETNQHSKEPLRVITGTANIAITSMPEQTGEFARMTLRATFTGKPTIKKRNTAV